MPIFSLNVNLCVYYYYVKGVGTSHLPNSGHSCMDGAKVGVGAEERGWKEWVNASGLGEGEEQVD